METLTAAGVALFLMSLAMPCLLHPFSMCTSATAHSTCQQHVDSTKPRSLIISSLPPLWRCCLNALNWLCHVCLPGRCMVCKHGIEPVISCSAPLLAMSTMPSYGQVCAQPHLRCGYIALASMQATSQKHKSGNCAPSLPIHPYC